MRPSATPRQIHLQQLKEESRATHSAVQQHSFFREAGLSGEAMSALADLVQLQIVRVGETIVNERELQDFFVLLSRGELRLKHANETVGVIDAGGTFGARYLLLPEPTLYTVQTTMRSELIILDGPAFDQFQLEFPKEALKLQAHLARALVAELKKAQTNLRLLYETLKAV